MKRLIIKIAEFFRVTRLRNKLLISYILLTIIPFSIMGTYLFLESVDSIKKNASSSINITMIQTKKNIEESLSNIENLTWQIIGTPNIENWIVYKNPVVISVQDVRQKVENEYKINDLLKTYTAFTTDFNITMYINDGRLIGSTEAAIYNSMFEEFLKISGRKSSNWILQSDKTAPGYSLNNVFFIKRLSSLKTSEGLGIIIVHLQDNFFDKIFGDVNLSGGFMFITDEQGRLVNETRDYLYKMKNPEFMKKVPLAYVDSILKSQEGQFQWNNEIVFFKTINKTGWKLIGVIPVSYLVKDLASIRSNIIILVCIVLLFSIIFAIALSTGILKPINKLQHAIEKFGRGDMNSFVEISTRDEIYKISVVFNKMVSRINDLMEKTYKAEKEKRHAELSALQSQINPHFLYNTLDTLRWISKSRNQEDLSQVILDLSEFFKIGLSKGKELITIMQELTHTFSYLNIQKFRYVDKFDFEISIPSEIQSCFIPKIIIQPIVENAIYHGIKNKKGKGNIFINGCIINENIVITVIDNGRGIDENALQNIKEEIRSGEPNKGKVYGIKNVHERIQLWFGNSYGLDISSKIDEGTCVRITIPIVEDVSKYDRNT